MSPEVQNYQALVADIFGHGTVNLPKRSQSSNHVLGALNASGDFQNFGANFSARLKRLHEIYRSTSSYEGLIRQVEQVADPKNWQGAVAELAAFDLFNSESQFLSEPPALDARVPPSDTLCSSFGGKEGNLDLHFPWFDVYADVKVLMDNVQDILNGIYAEIWDGQKLPMVSHEYPRGASWGPIQESRRKILQRLSTHLDRKPRMVDCDDLVPGLRFRFEWSAGVLITESSYSPYRHAEELRLLPFHHAKKFHRKSPFFLTFVSFPWFNQAITSFHDANRTFYRALARRTFCEHAGDKRPFRDLFPRFQDQDSLSEVASRLAGIMFIEDKSILGDEPNDVNAVGHFYANPNAVHNIPNHPVEDYIRSVARGGYEDFAHDNY